MESTNQVVTETIITTTEVTTTQVPTEVTITEVTIPVTEVIITEVTTEVTAPVTLGYWAIRGLAEPIRLLLEYTGLAYNQKKYTSNEDWQADKQSIGFDFPNLPYLLSCYKKITESEAIHMFICIKSGHKELLGTTCCDKVTLATVRGVFHDAKSAVYGAIYGGNFTTTIDAILKERVIPKFALLDTFAGTTGTGLIKTGLTYVDFQFYEFAQLLLSYDPTILDNFANLKTVVATVAALPQIQSYLASDRFQARPFNGGSAGFNPQ